MARASARSRIPGGPPCRLIADERLLTSALEIGLSPRLSLGLHGEAGLGDGAADFGAGVRLGWRIF